MKSAKLLRLGKKRINSFVLLWLYPKSVVAKLGIDYADEIRNRQQTIIAMMLSPNAIMNLQSSQFISEKAYTVDEYFNDIFDAVWKPLSDKDEEKNSYRRQQQRAYVDFIGMALNASEGSDGKNTSMAQRLMLCITRICCFV